MNDSINLLPDGTKQIRLAKSQFADINKSLHQFYKRTRCSTIMLTDISGLMIAKQGNLNSNITSLLSTLAAADYAATNEMSKLIGEKNGFQMHFHEGATQNLYLTSVDESCYLVVVFSKETTFGLIRVLISKAIEEIRSTLQRQESCQEVEEMTQTDKELESTDFQEELSARLNNILACKE